MRCVLITAAVVIAMLAAVSAHVVEVTGTIVAHSGQHLEVRTAAGEVVAMKIDASTAIMRNRRRVEVDELKPGVRIEAQTLDDADADLVAFLVTILPAKE